MRVSKPPQERRAELVSAARLLFDKNGVDKTRVSDIVKHVGVAQGVFYYYFSSKAEIVAVVVQQVRAEVDARAEAILQDEAAGYGRQVAGFIDLMLDVVDQFLGDDESSTRSLGDFGAGMVSPLIHQYLARLVALGVAQGHITVPYPQESALVALYGLRGLADESLPGKAMIYAIIQQALGLPPGMLTQYCAPPLK